MFTKKEFKRFYHTRSQCMRTVNSFQHPGVLVDDPLSAMFAQDIIQPTLKRRDDYV